MDQKDRFTKGLPISAVPETLRIRFTRELNDLREGNVEEVNFPPTLSTVERKFLHSLAQELGLVSKSKGKDEKRFITVTKRKTSAKNEGIIHPFFDLNPKTKNDLIPVISDYTHVMSSVKNAKLKGKQSRKKNSSGNQNSSAKNNRFAPMEETAEYFLNRQRERVENKEYKQIQKKRSGLPSYNHAQDVVEMIRGHQISLISGETGCGKTTQVPQFILDDPDMGRSCRIAVTQPRRISATSVAERIAYERSEKVGDIVGYNIRLENETSRHSKVVFMTPGVLLRIAQEDPSLSEFSHIIIDEAHERDRYTDFLFIILRDLLVLNSREMTDKSQLKLILMSATLQTQKLSDYFGGIPNLHIGSSVHPVQQFYLEHILRFVRFFDDASVSSSRKKVGNAVKIEEKTYTCPICQGAQKFLSSEELGTHVASCFGIPTISTTTSCQLQEKVPAISETGLTEDFEDLGLSDEAVNMTEDCENDSDFESDDDIYSTRAISLDAIGVSQASSSVDDEMTKSDEDLLHKYQVSWDDSECDYDLIENLLEYICASEYTRNNDATVLVFLPGWDTISSLSRVLQNSDTFGNEKLYKIIPLHSGVPRNLQKEAFKPAPRGVLKIVLSTNIAETSVTIDNVTVVIDTGRSKEKGYDPHLKLSSLKESWISQSSARQRKGRAGRTRPGVCFRLYSSRRHASLPIYQESEILRTSLEELALLCKIMGLAPGHRNSDKHDDLHSFLLKAMDPPHALSITNALELLENINCLDKESGEVTPLGYTVSQLPVDPCIGRLIVIGLMTGCASNAIKVACAMSYRDPFLMPIDEQQRIRSRSMKKNLAQNLPSDQITTLRAILQYNQISTQQNFRATQRFCDDYFLSRNTMSYLQTLCQSVSQNVLMSTRINPGSSFCLRNNDSFIILNSLVGFGLYSNIAIRKNSNTIFTTEKGRKGKVHPSSLNNTSTSISAFRPQCGKEIEVVGFQDLVSLPTQKGKDSRIGGASVQMLGTSPVSVFVLLLACGSFRSVTQEDFENDKFHIYPPDESNGIVLCLIDEWLPIRMYRQTFQIICDTRECLNDSISSFLLHHRSGKSANSQLPRHISSFLGAMTNSLAYEHQSSFSAGSTTIEALKNDTPRGEGNMRTLDNEKKVDSKRRKKSTKNVKT